MGTELCHELSLKVLQDWISLLLCNHTVHINIELKSDSNPVLACELPQA